MKIFCGKHAGKVRKKCSCKEIREPFYGFISGAILFMNLRVLKTADATVAIAIREATRWRMKRLVVNPDASFVFFLSFWFFLYLTKVQTKRGLGLRISFNNSFKEREKLRALVAVSIHFFNGDRT